MMKAAQLRQAILQAAVQGKLVPQNPHDEPASVLLERIRVEKAKLIKAGKLKKEKPLPSITQDEIPYDLPNGWIWCRFGNIFNIRSSKRVHESDWRKSGIPFYRAREIATLSQCGKVDNDLFISEELYNQHKVSSGVPEAGDLMITAVGTLGKTWIVKKEDVFYYKDASVISFGNIGKLNPKYFRYLMSSPFMMSQIKSDSSGTTVGTLTIIRANNYLAQLPPLVEQSRIVAKVDELMAVCDELEAAEKKSDALDEHFMEYLPKSILQAAVHGKLVPQNPSDEPASVLLERIRAEKMKLVKAGKLKKEKPLPPITEDEILYDLPDGWEWCRLGEIHTIYRGITFPASAKGDVHTKGVVCCATTGSVQETYNSTADVYVPEKYVKNRDQWLLDNDIIMSTANSRELVGKTCFWNGGERKTFGGFLTVIRACGCLSVKYSYYVLQYLWKTGAFVTTSTQTTNIANINNSVLANTIIPIPPLAEQERIVAKVDELMALCAKLKTAAEDVEILETKQATIIPLGRPQENESLRMAARGKVNKEVSEAHRKAREDMFNDD